MHRREIGTRDSKGSHTQLDGRGGRIVYLRQHVRAGTGRGLRRKRGRMHSRDEGPAYMGLDVGVDILIIGRVQGGEQRAKSGLSLDYGGPQGLLTQYLMSWSP